MGIMILCIMLIGIYPAFYNVATEAPIKLAGSWSMGLSAGIVVTDLVCVHRWQPGTSLVYMHICACILLLCLYIVPVHFDELKLLN